MHINYNYTIAVVEGATGYAECKPDPEPQFAEGLRLLEGRPLDTFLHKHLLAKLNTCDKKQWLKLARSCIAEKRRVIAALLLEAATLAPQPDYDDILRDLRELATPWHELTPLPYLAKVQQDIWLRTVRENIHQHKHLDGNYASLLHKQQIAEIACAMANSRGALDKARKEIPFQTAPLQGSDPHKIWSEATALLAANGILEKGEMRHEASLSPIALLRSWNIKAGSNFGRNSHSLSGEAIAYGRGLKLAKARAACVMEALERASAHAFANPCGQYGKIGAHELLLASYRDLEKAGIPAISPASICAIPDADNLPLHWLAGQSPHGEKILAPAQAVYLFCNLDEASVCEHIGSTGLASGATPQMAKLGALGEVLERDAHATTPFLPDTCFTLKSRNPVIQSLLDDYAWRGIRVQFQDITNEFGFPVYRCFVYGHEGGVCQATGASLCGAKAAIAALTETPWPYVWAKPEFAPSGQGMHNLPARTLEELPDFSLPSDEANLALLETALSECGFKPIYVDLSRPELKFPVYRVFIPGLANDPEHENGVHPRFWARVAYGNPEENMKYNLATIYK